jgi:regulator of protease activity HflC (stomatin/prohibitin superfamily)
VAKETTMVLGLLFTFLLAVLVLTVIILALALFTVEQQTAAVIERFGKFVRIAGPGLNIRVPLIDAVAHRVSLRVVQASIQVDSKSKDNVFVDLAIAVQYQVKLDAIRDAVYQLTDPQAQLEAYVLDAVRARVPSMDLTQVFEDKESIAAAVDSELSARMEQYGYTIVNVLVNDVIPDQRVRDAMNEVQAATREREAAAQRAEAARVTLVKQAEAEAESKRLQGEGLANQRKAIAQGLRESVELVSAGGSGAIDEGAVMDLLLLVQWMDTQKEIAANDRATVIFVPNNPSAVADIGEQIRTSLFAAQAARLDASDTRSDRVAQAAADADAAARGQTSGQPT